MSLCGGTLVPQLLRQKWQRNLWNLADRNFIDPDQLLRLNALRMLFLLLQRGLWTLQKWCGSQAQAQLTQALLTVGNEVLYRHPCRTPRSLKREILSLCSAGSQKRLGRRKGLLVTEPQKPALLRSFPPVPVRDRGAATGVAGVRQPGARGTSWTPQESSEKQRTPRLNG